MEYADDKHIILNINDRNKYGNYPLLWAIIKNNTELVQLIIDYAIRHNIILILNDKDIQDKISIFRFMYDNDEDNNIDYNSIFRMNIVRRILSILDIKEDIIKLLLLNMNKICILFSDNGKLLEKFIDMIILYNKRYMESGINNVNNNETVLNVNVTDVFKGYPFLWAIIQNNIKIVQNIINYANINNYFVKLNKKDIFGNYPLLMAVKKNNLEIVNLIMKYANQHKIILELNENDINGNYPLLTAIVRNNSEMVHRLVGYANQNNIQIKFMESDLNNEVIRYYSNIYQDLSNINTEIIDILYQNRNNGRINIVYSNNSDLLKGFERMNFNTTESVNSISQDAFCNNNIGSNNIDINDDNGTFLMHQAIRDNDLDRVELIIDKANERNIILNMNQIGVFGDYPVLWAVIKNNTKLVCLIMNYAKKKDIILELNKKDVTGNNPLLMAVSHNNIGIVQLIIEYANKHEIILEVNKKKDNENYPLLMAIINNNTEMVHLLY
ncbi:hypothetical protein PIROE2DRAFT_58395 [Piromyces sp. E2]|nr:hypothetical protein PIROE2DRAFT_58395 [Piromyces sp. E2]|eukprot:OUM68004.1 hypothetical protein PIROE2DRAFT_58395 [Piromyces sp. E2]